MSSGVICFSLGQERAIVLDVYTRTSLALIEARVLITFLCEESVCLWRLRFLSAGISQWGTFCIFNLSFILSLGFFTTMFEWKSSISPCGLTTQRSTS